VLKQIRIIDHFELIEFTNRKNMVLVSIDY